MRIEGVVVPAAVPLTPRQSPDLEAYRRLLGFLIESGVHGIFANGSMGAFALLTDTAQFKVVEAAVEFVDGRLPLLVGASDTGTARVLHRVRVLERMRVDGIVVLPPYFYLLEQRELLRFYLTIADASQKPIIVYDNPRLTKNALALETISQLARHPNISGMKISRPDVSLWRELLDLSLDRDRFAVLCGAGRMTNAGLRLGFDGITEGLHNVVPALAVRLYRAERAGRCAESDRIQEKINRCFRIFEIDGSWRGLSVALEWLGICRQAALAPYDLPIAEETRTAIRMVLEQELGAASARVVEDC